MPPQEERSDLPIACYRSIIDPDPNVHMAMARAIMEYQLTTSIPPLSPSSIKAILQNDRFNLSFIRAFLHYAYNLCFLQPDQLLSQIENISHLPAILVHGSCDTVCFPEQAHLLHQKWSNSQLWIIEGAGHSSEEPAIGSALVQATDAFLKSLKNEDYEQ